MIYFVLAIHILLSIGIVVAILLHNPQGSGLSGEIASGISYQGRTLLERYLDRITIGLVLGFVVTTALLLVLFR